MTHKLAEALYWLAVFGPSISKQYVSFCQSPGDQMIADGMNRNLTVVESDSGRTVEFDPTGLDNSDTLNISAPEFDTREFGTMHRICKAVGRRYFSVPRIGIYNELLIRTLGACKFTWSFDVTEDEFIDSCKSPSGIVDYRVARETVIDGYRMNLFLHAGHASQRFYYQREHHRGLPYAINVPGIIPIFLKVGSKMGPQRYLKLIGIHRKVTNLFLEMGLDLESIRYTEGAGTW
jgi:hypothetical protein